MPNASTASGVSVANLNRDDLLKVMYYRNEREKGYCQQFIELIDSNPELDFRRSLSAPWQFDVKLSTGTIISMWPHKLKAVNQRTYASFEFVQWSDAAKILGF